MNIIIADHQDITRAGLLYVISKMKDVVCHLAADKQELLYQLKKKSRIHCYFGLYTLRPEG